MSTKPIVSIITASYNHADFIGAAIESVQQQDYESWELLVADDSSTDHSLDILALYADDPRIKVFPFKINREYHMRNFAAGHARGDYIAFLNSDDLFLPGKMRKQVELLESKPQFAAVFTHVKCIDESNKRLSSHHLEKLFAVTNQTRHQWLRQFFFSGNSLCISSAVVRRNCFEEIGKFNPLLTQISDLDLWIKLCFKWEIYVIPENLTGMRVFKGHKNLSTPSPTSNSQLLLECQQAYDHYLSANGLEQMTKIFPELKEALPEDTPQWRYYLLCRTATAMPFTPMRLLGFSRLHKLLKNEETKKLLQHRNPRLMRTFFLSEGAAGLGGNHPGITWKICFPDQKGMYCPENSYSCWTIATKEALVCFSFPAPTTSGRLCLRAEGHPIPLIYQRIRLYNQESGELIFDSRCPPIDESIPKSKKTRFSMLIQMLTRRKINSCFRFAKIDFSAFSSKWIDIEIEYANAPYYSFLSLLKRIVVKLRSKLLSCLY